MRLLLRAAFWLGIVLLLLPSGGSNEAPSTPAHEITGVQAASAASATVSDMRQFCARQPAACAVGGQIAVVLGQRAQAGAKILYEFLHEKLAGQDARPMPASAAGTSAPASSQNTLTPGDLAPQWRGAPRKDNKRSA